MTISSTTRVAGPFIGNGTATVFPFTFKVFAAADLDVIRLNSSTGVETTLVLNSDYTVTLNGNQNTNPGGSVTLSAGALATGLTLTITSDIANLQPTDLTNQGGFYPEVITDSLDRATIQIQQMADDLTRSIKTPISDGLALNMELPTAAQRANSFLAFDASGEPTTVTAGSSGAPTTITRQTFSGTGAQTVFTLASDPGALGNSAQVYIGGVYQQRSTYTIAGTTLTFSSAPVAGTDNIEFVNFLTSNIGATSADLVTYTPAGSGAVARSAASKFGEVVSVKDFGAVGNGVADDIGAFNLATAYCEANDIHLLHIPAGRYHLSTFWRAPSPAVALGSDPDSFQPCIVKGYGAILDNTVLFENSCGAEGIRVKRSPDVGFVFTRGQGGSFHNLIAEQCVHGFYFGTTSRQQVTIASTTGFAAGQTVTGATSGATGTIDYVSGSVLYLVGCNKTKANTTVRTVANSVFAATETITSSGGGSSTVTSVTTPYGNNYQVTRATFVNCIGYQNERHGWLADGVSPATRSWVNANTFVCCGGVYNSFNLSTLTADNALNGQGVLVCDGSGPSGNNEHNYNTFTGFNVEGNSANVPSFEDRTGRQNTYIGGHFAAGSAGSYSFRSTDALNFMFGGRHEGIQDLSGVACYIYNDDTTAIVGLYSPLFDSSSSGGGVKLPSSASNADANTLDCYVEGTFTPVFMPESGAFGSVTYDQQVGKYTIVGSTVTLTVVLRTSALTVGTATGNVTLAGVPAAILPTSAAVSNYRAVSVMAANWTNTPVAGYAINSGIVLNLSTAAQVAVANLATGANSNLTVITASYQL